MRSSTEVFTDDQLNSLKFLQSNMEDMLAKETKLKEDAYKQQKKYLTDYLSSVTKDISTLEKTLSPMSTTISKLRGDDVGDSLVQSFKSSISEAMNLSLTDDYTGFQEALSQAVKASNSLFDPTNFSSIYDMEFAQEVAANQFQSLEDSTLSQIDILKLIEENTRNQLDNFTGNTALVGTYEPIYQNQSTVDVVTTQNEPIMSLSSEIISLKVLLNDIAIHSRRSSTVLEDSASGRRTLKTEVA